MAAKEIKHEARDRDLSDYLSQLATLAAGSIVLLGTFAGSTEDAGRGGAFAIAAIACFAVSILGAMAARITIIYLAYGELTEGDKKYGPGVVAAAGVAGLFGFAFGVVALAVYAGMAV